MDLLRLELPDPEFDGDGVDATVAEIGVVGAIVDDMDDALFDDDADGFECAEQVVPLMTFQILRAD